MIKALKQIPLILCCLFLLWLVLSYVEIVSKNVSAGATYNDYNIIVNFIDYVNIKYYGGIF